MSYFSYLSIIIDKLVKCGNVKNINKNQRVLEEDDQEDEKPPFKNLKIYYDRVSLNGNFAGYPNWEKNKDTFDTAMNDVQEILEEYIDIRDNEENSILQNIDDWNLGVFDRAFFEIEENMALFNLYIFFKVGELNEENELASSKIIMVDDYSTPKIGLITLSQDLPEI